MKWNTIEVFDWFYGEKPLSFKKNCPYCLISQVELVSSRICHPVKGRTETLRSCTMDLVAFCKIADCPKSDRSEKRWALKKAIHTHNRLMSEARQGRGCDRHLFGLACIAEENGIPLPKLLTDPAFNLSGGNGHFVLSTSTCGYTGMSGGTSPMCLDGYGCFYNFEEGCIWLWITAFRQSFETSVEKFHGTLIQASVVA